MPCPIATSLCCCFSSSKQLSKLDTPNFLICVAMNSYDVPWYLSKRCIKALATKASNLSRCCWLKSWRKLRSRCSTVMARSRPCRLCRISWRRKTSRNTLKHKVWWFWWVNTMVMKTTQEFKKTRFVNWRLSLSAPVGVPCKIGAFCFCLRNKGSTSRVSLKSCQICIFDVGSEDHLRWNNTAKIYTSPTHCTHTGNVQINLNGHKRQCCKVNVQHAKHHKCATENTGILLVSAYVIPHLAVHNPLQNEKTSKCGAELQSCFKGQYVDPQKCFPLPWALSS